MLVGGGIMILMVGAVAVFIINKAFKGSLSVEDCTAMIKAGKVAGQAIINSTPLGPIVP